MKPPLLLDLFSGSGGAARGYADAGFDIVGVDSALQPHYPYDFILADALEFLDTADLSQFDAIHASPPCQAYTRARYIQQNEHVMLLEPVRHRLQQINLPWVIENVSDAPMSHFLLLCGTQFGLKVYRHRQFESNILLFSPGSCSHPHELLPDFVCIYGNGVRGRQIGNTGNNYARYSVSVGRLAMGIDWTMTQNELSQAIPPAYTKFIGEQLMAVVQSEVAV